MRSSFTALLLTAPVMLASTADALADGPATWTALSTSELGAARARGADQDLSQTSSIVLDTITAQDTTADNTIAGDAFRGFTGFANVLQLNGSGSVASQAMNVVVTISR